MDATAHDIDLQWTDCTMQAEPTDQTLASSVPHEQLAWTGYELPWPEVSADDGAADPEISTLTDTDDPPNRLSTQAMSTPSREPTPTAPAMAETGSGDQYLIVTPNTFPTDEKGARANSSPSRHDDEQRGKSGEAEDLFEQYATKYELRPQASKAGFTSTWIDHDETGDYDPSKEFRRSKPRRNRLKLRDCEDAETTFDSTDEDVVSREVVPREREKLIVKLVFPSEESKATYRTHVSNCPAKTEYSPDDFSTGYRLRKKTLGRASHHGIASHLDRPTDAPDVPADLTGYPIARGCWGCLKLGISCPLLDDERAWPCVTCLEDDHDCELVTQPARKRACERCKRKRTVCSYTDTFDHSGPCEECSNDGYRCVAGPLKESIITRIRYDRDWVKDPLISKKASKPKKTYWTCMQCREGGRACSFSTGGTGEDCTTCELAGSICIPEKVVTPQHHKATPSSVSAPKKRIAARAQAEQETPTKKQKTTTKPVATTKMITTKFCHPMIFNYEDTDGDQPCDFCETSNFAILGLGPKEVEVIEWSDNRGLTELGGGHMQDGAVSTKVCTPCTLQRVPIIMCQRHEMRPIPGVSLETLDVDGAFMALFSGEQRKTDRWCSICPSLATYECEAQGSADGLGNPCDGCGLSLCEQCTVSLSGAYDGDLQAMLAELEDEPSVRPLGLRADFELLRQDGLLMQYVLQQ